MSMTSSFQQIFCRYLLCCCGILLGASSLGCSASSPRTTTQQGVELSEGDEENDTTTAQGSEDNPAIDRHTVLAEIMTMMGIPYVTTGIDSTGFDCSGFTAKIYGEMMGTILPHSSQRQFAMGKVVKRRQLKFGDLVFFRMEGASPSHVGIYVGDGLFVHASTSLGVTVSLLDSSYYKRRYVGARRIVE